MTTPEQRARELLNRAISNLRDGKVKQTVAELTTLIEKADALDWLQENMQHYIVDTDTLIPPKWFITDPSGNGVLVRRAETLLAAINAAKGK